MIASDSMRLKHLCKPTAGDVVTYVSTLDCIVAILFRALVRIRMSSNMSLDKSSKKWRLVQPVDLRKRSIVPTSYFGNAMAAGVTGPLSAEDILDPINGLSYTASSNRCSIALGDHRASLYNLTALPSKLSSNERAVLVPFGLPQTCFWLTSWHSAETTNWDFGIGIPIAVRGPDSPRINSAVLYPDCTRSGIYDLYVNLLDHEQQLLCEDEEFRC